MAKGLNMQLVKSENRSLILYLLNHNKGLSRKEIAATLGLTPAAVTKICSRLIASGFVREDGESREQTGSGRREIQLSLCLEDKAALGINAEKDCITLSVTGFDGTLLKSKQIPFTADVSAVVKAAKAFKESYRGKAKLLAAGVCVIGSPEEDDFGVWKDKNLKATLEKELSLPVVIENNVKAFAESELIYGKIENPDSILFIKWGPGIGSAVVANGRVFNGSDSSVTELGHYIVNPGGVKCRCGRFGCLETEAGEQAILNELKSELPLDELLENCDNEVMNIIDHKINMVALAVTNTATILNADNIVLFGTMFKNDIIAQKLKKQCLRYNKNLTADIIKRSALNAKSAYIGCAAICAKRFFFEAKGE